MKKIFCLPYAGGSSAIYYKWRRLMSDSLTIHPIELKGRGTRINEDFYEHLDEAVNDIYDLIKDQIRECDYALFGHSMGGRLVYKLYCKIAEMQQKKPNHIFFSGCGIPKTKKAEGMIHALPDNLFLQRIMDMGGTSEELLHNKELQQLYLPILRSDFKMLEKDVISENKTVMDCDITVLHGINDKTISSDLICNWGHYTLGKCNFYTFEGNHFFIHQFSNEITDIINKTLR
ncbi:thioesterase [Bacillus velezensis]|uniref:thioesterase II family protein n=1 Tax=Bacillus TaxID=1386 RepID=UPI0007AA7357|nr:MULTISPECIES: thioesterase domain-containing protein [Bacillus]KZE58891.1 gramicidin dehydrogenase [Bacillus amyloliquefaciens]MDX7896974.1 thioesterase domain-containing protein [Bacillus velezensis]MDX8027678.1 thioesterase domain-containing protein [Bacillus velezensis]MDX8201225.1 thioesterase domain-containing protein [Bacillus velezensis]MDX8226918.1 thioesterase domain-containing protein [Bacillus velezensis]